MKMVLGIRSKSRKRVSVQVHYIIHVQEIKPWPPSQSLRSAQSVLLQWENGDKNFGSLASTAGNGKIEINESFRLSVLLWREASKRSKHRESFQKNCLEFYLYDKTGKSQLLGSATINLADFGIIKETKALSIQFNCKKSSRNSSQPFMYVTIQPFDLECSSSSPNSCLSKELSLDQEGSESASHSQSIKDDDDIEIASFTDDDSDDIPSNTFQTIRSASQITGDSSKISEGGTKGSRGEFVIPSESTSSSLLGNKEDEASSQFNGIKSPSSSRVLWSDMGNATNGNTRGEASSQFNGIKSPSSSRVLWSDMGNATNGNTRGEASSQFNGIKSPSSSIVLCSDMGNAANGNTQGEASSQFNGIKSPSSSRVLRSDMRNAADDNTWGEASSQFNGIKSPSLSIVLCSDMGNAANGNTQGEASSLFNGIKSPSSSMVLCSDMGNAANGNTKGEASSQFNGIKSPSSSRILCSHMGNAANDNTQGEASSQFNGIKSPSSSMVLCSDMGNAANDNTQGEASSQFNGIKSPSSSIVLCSDMGNAANGNTEGEASSQFNGNKSPSLSKVLCLDIGNVANGNTKGEASSQFNGIKSPSSSKVLCSNMGNDANGNTQGEAPSQFNGIKSPSSSKVLCSDMGNAANDNTWGEASSQFNGIKSPSSSIVLCSDMGNAANGNTEGEASSQFNGIKSPSSSKVLCSDMGNAANGNMEGEASSLFDGIKSPSSSKVLCSDMGNVADGNIEGGASSQFNGIKSPSSSTILCSDMGNAANGNIDGEVSSEFNGIKSPSSSTVLYSNMGNATKGRPLLPNSKESVKLADASSEIQESIQQSSAAYISSSMKQNFERSFQSQVTQEDSMIQEDGTRDQTFNKDALEKVSSVPNTRVMEDKEEMEEGRKGQGQFTMRNELLENELVNNVSDDGSTKKWKFTTLLNKKSHEHPTSILMNDKTEDVTNVKFPLQSAENYGLFISNQTHNQAEEINTMNDVHVGTACHEDINVNDSFLNNKTELKAEVEMLREELREAAALEVSMYSVIAEHCSSSNKVHAPARRLSRFYFHACRVGSPATIASAAQSAVSGFVLVSKACGNDVPRLTFWFSNIILLKAIVSKGVENVHFGDGPCINSECDVSGSTLHEEDNTEKHFHSWQDPETFLVALEKVEAWIFSRIVESVWWQTLTPYMQSAAAKSSSSRKAYERRYRVGDQDQGSFSIDLWKRAFTDACDRLCPIRAGGHECGCLPVIARLVMEQLVSRLDVAMFNAILRESAEEMPMDPISDPISDSKVLPIPAGKSGFGAGAQLKNAIGDWSRWLSDLFSIDDSDSLEVSNENDELKCESSFKPFQLLNALSDLMMLPLDMLADASVRKEVCPRFGISLIKRVVYNFVPDEFSPGPIPDAVIDALNDEDIQDDEGSITSFPCSAGSTFYAPPPASSVMGMLQEVGTKTSLRRGSFVLKKLYTSDDELDELDSPLSALGMDDSSRSSKEKIALVKGGRKVVRYDLLREAWKSSE